MSLLILLALMMTAVVIHQIHDDYLYPQLRLMIWDDEDDPRPYKETTYYHRYCTSEDFTANSVPELVITDDYTAQEATEHMLTHGASIYPNLLTNDTAKQLRDWIVRENKLRDGWNVIENKNRYSWGIDMNQHPKLQTFFEELVANELFLATLEKIVGPDPSIIEFTAITSSYGATDQYLHADVIPDGSGAKFGRSFMPSYSLFVPLQDTTYGMGATHVCPGTHLCSSGATKHCPKGWNVPMSGPQEEGGVWLVGAGALVNQQTYHKGMGFTQKGAPDRVVLIATFAPRSIHKYGLETRMIGQGGSYSLIWHQWGHTLYDYVHADTRMTEPQKTLRSLGIIKGNGINFIQSASMRMANEQIGMGENDYETFVEEGGFAFLPKSWQGKFGERNEISDFHEFAVGTLKMTETKLKQISMIAVATYFLFALAWDMIRWFALKDKLSSRTSVFLSSILRIAFMYGLVVGTGWLILQTVEETNWAKAIRSGKMYRLPSPKNEIAIPGTIPHRTDVLLTSHYASDYLASYSHVIDYSHPGNVFWKGVIRENADGYRSLSNELKLHFCKSLIESIANERRFLRQHPDRFWYNVTDATELTNNCHRGFLRESSPLHESLAFQLDALRSEAEFGRFRSSAMQSTIIPQLLNKWDVFLLPSLISVSKSSTTDVTTNLGTRQGEFAQKKSSRMNTFVTKKSERILFRRRTLPPKPPRHPPTPYAWLQEGDKVLARYKCRPDGKLEM
jgi:hypothetical protein